MFKITREPVDLNEIVAAVTDPEAGALVLFVGVTRNHNEGRKVLGLDYEAYPEMAEQELARIGADAGKRWALKKIAIAHRIGAVPVTEPSVVIAVSAAHREDSFAACRFAIEEIKKSAPIWKKELFEGGELWIGTQTGEPFAK
jgi:molybdopterin synthase catalytic subunit